MAARPQPASSTPTGINQGLENLSESRPNSGWIMDDRQEYANISPPVA